LHAGPGGLRRSAGSGVRWKRRAAYTTQVEVCRERPLRSADTNAGLRGVTIDGRGGEAQAATRADDSAVLAHQRALRLVTVDGAALQTHRAVERVDAPSVGVGADRLVGVDRVVGQRQHAVGAVDPPALRGAGRVDLVTVDDGVGDRGAAAGGGEAPALGG